MSPAFDLPCNSDGICMACKKRPPMEETVACQTCATPWHVPCLSNPPETVASVAQWQCPDCSLPASGTTEALTNAVLGLGGAAGDLISSIRSIEADESLTEQDKARRRQELISGRKQKEKADVEKSARENDVLGLLDDTFNCSFCMQLPERPVTTPCGHNFCLKCFQKWLGHGRHTCAKCRAPIPPKMVSQPRINSALVVAIRMAKTVKLMPENKTIVYHQMSNENRPDRAFTTERAKKAGKANACSGQIFVTVPPDHFGPILAEHDPKRSKGVLVGESWEDRMECRQWGTHRPHVAGIAGQSGYGAQSVALSGGYEDDEDHGEWFLYTGSGGRDLSGNKRTNKDQSFDQKFEKLNEALRVSCKKGYPVRVVRSHKEKRSAYAPEFGVRYDGIYRIEKCWRKVGVQGFKVCRYLFVRCDNEPAPWTSDENGDLPRPLPDIKELKRATDITERKEGPAWDYKEKSGWCWTKPPPDSRQILASQESRKILACPEGIEILASPDAEEKNGVRKKRIISTNVKERLLKEFKCGICRRVMSFPVTTPCAHHFCKKCLLDAYDDQSFMRERTRGGRTLRTQKIVKKCPSCTIDISDFLQNPQVNREVMDLIDSLQQKMKQENDVEGSDGNGNAGNEGEIDMDDPKVKHVENGMAAEELRPSDGVIDSMNDSKFSDNGDLAGKGNSVARKECEWFQEEKIETVEGDSDANPRSSETKKSTKEQSHRLERKRNQPTAKNKTDKKAKKGGDVNGGGRNDSQLDC